MANLEDFIYLSEQVIPLSNNQYLMACINPAHFDKTPSLAIKKTTNKEGKDDVLIHCFGGCLNEELFQIANGKSLSNPTISTKILEKLARGESVSNEFVEKTKYVITKTYDYIKDGELKFQKVRYEPKRFGYRRPSSATQKEKYNIDWIYKLNDTEHLLYNVDLLEKFKDKDNLIFIDESEKNIDFFTSMGLIATCPSNPSLWLEDWNQYFIKKDIVIFPHFDKKGESVTLNQFNHLKDLVKSFKVGILPARKINDDVLDWWKDTNATEVEFWDVVDNSLDFCGKTSSELEDTLKKRTLVGSDIILEPLPQTLEKSEPTKTKPIIPIITDKEYLESLCYSCFSTGFKAFKDEKDVVQLMTEFGDDNETPLPVLCMHVGIDKRLLPEKQQEEIIEEISAIAEINMDDLGF